MAPMRARRRMASMGWFRELALRGEERPQRTAHRAVRRAPAASEGEHGHDPAAPGVLAPYDPRYDPLTARNPGRMAPTTRRPTGSPAPARRRRTTARSRGHRRRRRHRRLGLHRVATALFLAREHGIKATVLEANRAVWGCTSRNGGQGQNASGRLYRSQWIARWGKEDGARARRRDPQRLRDLQEPGRRVPECEPQPGGHLYIAHREKKMDFLRNEAKVMREVFGYDTRMPSPDEVRSP